MEVMQQAQLAQPEVVFVATIGADYHDVLMKVTTGERKNYAMLTYREVTYADRTENQCIARKAMTLKDAVRHLAKYADEEELAKAISVIGKLEE